MGGLSRAAVSPAGRWVTDPLLLLALLAAAATSLGALQLTGALALSWHVPALLAVVAAGLALSGST